MADEDSALESAPSRLALEIRRIRQDAGLSQSALAYRLGYTRNYVSMAERVGTNLPARNLVEALDRTLATGGFLQRLWNEAKQEQLTTRRSTQLSTTRFGEDIVRAGMPRLRQALTSCDVPDDGPVRPWHVLRAAVEQITEQRVQARYAQVITELPDLLMELGRARELATTELEQREAIRLVVLAYRAADGIAFKYSYHDLSARIIESMRLAVAQTDDPLLSAAVAYVRTETFFVSKDLAAARRSLVRAVDMMPNRLKSTSDNAAAHGSLHMRAAVVAAREGKADDASDHLTYARRAADGVPEGVYLGTAFGPASVRIHEVSVAQELGDSPTAVQQGAGWHPPRELPAERRSHFYIDLAPAQLNVGKFDDCFSSLQHARLIAPQHVREHPRVRSTLGSLLSARRTADADLAAFAAWAGVS